MKRPVKALQLPRVVADGFRVLVTGRVRVCGRANLSPGPDSRPAVRRAGWVKGRGALAQRRRRRPWSGQAGADNGAIGAGAVWQGVGWRGARPVGVACRGGVVAVATATLICACRDRRSVFRRMVPLTNYEGWGYLNSARGGRSCGGERPGRPPARGTGHQLVISAQTKPASSRAIAVTATPAGLPRAVMVL
jgi:hypothetical protein